jgi:hypothetical protein
MHGEDVRRYQNNLSDELDGATLYTAIAAAETSWRSSIKPRGLTRPLPNVLPASS